MAGNGGFVLGFAGNNPEEIGQQIFSFLATVYTLVLPMGWRKKIEHFQLIVSLITFALFVIHHETFMYGRHHAFLGNLTASWPKGGVLRVEVLRIGSDGNFLQPYVPEGKSDQENFRDLSNLVKALNGLKTQMHTDDILFNSEEEQQQINEELNRKKFIKIASPKKGIDSRGEYEVVGGVKEADTSIPKTYTDKSQTKPITKLSKLSTSLWELYIDLLAELSLVMEKVLQNLQPDEGYILEFSETAEILLVSSDVRSLLNVPVTTVTLDISNDSCFSSLLVRLLNTRFFNYNNLIAAHIKMGAKHKYWRWYMKNVVTEEHQMFTKPFSVLWYSSAYVGMVIFSISIAGVIRFTRRMCVSLSHFLMEFGEVENFSFMVLANLIPIIIALLGVEQLLSIFFLDNATFYYVSLILLIADIFWNVALSPFTKRHWPKFFYLYLFMFYAYHLRFHGESSRFALLVSCQFMVHSMLYFIHKYELPIILAAR